MKIPQKVDYATRVMIQLARRHSLGTVSQLEDLGNAESVSVNFLAQILTDLKKAGLVISKRGKLGGYLLERHPSTITLYDIIVAIEGSLFDFNQNQEGQSANIVADTWKQMNQTLEKAASQITLESMAAKHQVPMFFI